MQLLQGSFGGMRAVQATSEVSGVEVRIEGTLRPPCWRQREVNDYPLLMELEMGTGICSWAWWEEVPDLVLASVCDPTELEGVNCEVVCMRLF